MECIIHSDSPPKVQVLKGTETVLEDKKKFAKIEKLNEGEYSVKFQINDASKSDEGNYKFVVQNEKGETMSETIEVTGIPEQKGKLSSPSYFLDILLFVIR